MKKLTALFFALLMIASLAACGGSADPTEQTATEAQTVTEAEVAEVSADGIDIDLTTMSATMVYSEVQNMMMNPQSYMGKTVKMQGALNVAEENDRRYFACIIKDATACCAQGIEFDWAGDHTYPDDYPEQGEDITVVGSFTTYKENTRTYCRLANADLTF